MITADKTRRADNSDCCRFFLHDFYPPFICSISLVAFMKPFISSIAAAVIENLVLYCI
jgi:hypothetical protein